MKLLIDINVVLDVVLKREAWHAESAALLGALEAALAHGYVAGHTVTTLHYIVRRAAGRAAADRAVTDLLRIVEVVPLGGPDFSQAMILGMSDIEDAAQVAAALRVGADGVVTRDVRDFRNGVIAAMTPGEALALL